jgi:hypothetical protein
MVTKRTPTIDGTGKLLEKFVPDRLSDAALTSTYVQLKQAAKNPDLLIVGAITRNGSDVITSAAVVWPDGTPGAFATDAIDPSGAINGYHITYGSPATKTYTQPTITRNSNGAATNVPQIVVS